MAILLIPFIYIAICSGMSSVLPDVDYKAVSPPVVEQVQSKAEEK